LDVNGVRALRGLTADKVKELVDEGKFFYVFDLGRKENGIRHLRFWVHEVVNPSGFAGMPLPEVIAKILPVSRGTFSGSEIGQWFLVSRPTVKRIGVECQGKVSSCRVLTIPRAPLAAFLSRRWVGQPKEAEK